MDILIVFMGTAFLGIIAALTFFFLKEQPSPKTPSSTGKDVKGPKELSQLPNKKAIEYEEKIKKIENELDNIKAELAKTKEEHKTLLEEKSHINFNMEQYEKFKKEYLGLKDELLKKEELLEKEISLRRAQTQELTQLKQDHVTVKEKIIETEDALRKSQTMVEAFKKTVEGLKKQISDHGKIVNEYSQVKSEGQWVSREEFNKIEAELKEKEQMLQKILAIKKES